MIQIWNARVQILVEIGQNHSGGNFGTSSFSHVQKGPCIECIEMDLKLGTMRDHLGQVEHE